MIRYFSKIFKLCIYILYILNISYAKKIKIGIYNICYYDYCYFQDKELKYLETLIINYLQKKGYKVIPWENIEKTLDKYQIKSHKEISIAASNLFKDKVDYLLIINLYESSLENGFIIGAKLIDPKTSFIVWSDIEYYLTRKPKGFLEKVLSPEKKDIYKTLIKNLFESMKIRKVNSQIKLGKFIEIIYPEEIYYGEGIPISINILKPSLAQNITKVFVIINGKKYYLHQSLSNLWKGYIDKNKLKRKTVAYPVYIKLKDKVIYVGNIIVKQKKSEYKFQVKINKYEIGPNDDLILKLDFSPILEAKYTNLKLIDKLHNQTYSLKYKGCPQIIKISKKALKLLPSSYYKIVLDVHSKRGAIIRYVYDNILIDHTPPQIEYFYEPKEDYFILHIKKVEDISPITEVKLEYNYGKTHIILARIKGLAKELYIPAYSEGNFILTIKDKLGNELKVKLQIPKLKGNKKLRLKKTWKENF